MQTDKKKLTAKHSNETHKRQRKEAIYKDGLFSCYRGKKWRLFYSVHVVHILNSKFYYIVEKGAKNRGISIARNQHRWHAIGFKREITKRDERSN
ncbi:hypothetical protein GCM10007140_23570 [Priestia taiwanensis]|uniref:Uncharacterized protein n=1 Tax=Priestia taiwanensis TaxID=1347902 RepID=A0A917ASN9_9BACI|nr:hypothetical protein GCM10007140_23570 [Priestia taiwanensis]